MNRFFVLIIAGLCLATFSALGCGNDGPISPPLEGGDIIITGDIIAGATAGACWGYYPGVNQWQFYWSTDNYQWVHLGTYNTTCINWIVPSGVESTNFRLKAEGWKNGRSIPWVIYQSKGMIIHSFGELDHLDLLATNENIVATAKDSFGNIVPENGAVEVWMGISPDLLFPVGIAQLEAGICVYTPAITSGATYYFQFCIEDICAEINMTL